MASNVLTSSLGSPLVIIKASSRPSKMTLGPQSIAFRGLTLSDTTTSSLVVRAQQDEGEISKEISHIDTPPNDKNPTVKTPSNKSEDEKEIKMWFDVPGLTAPGIDVNVVANLLIIKGIEVVDAVGRKIYSPFDNKIQLPLNCATEETQAVLKNGVLCISVPKITKAEDMKFIQGPVRFVHVPVKAI